MERLMNDDYSYNYKQFYGKTGTVFTFIGTEMPRINSKIENQVDSFKTALGEYVDLNRWQILEQVKQGKMRPVITSESKVATYNKKKYNEALGRAI